MHYPVNVWEETVIIPTYAVGKPEKNPLFLEKRVYQGSSGVVYPHAVIEKIADVKTDMAWQAVFLENRYLKIMILPQLGGRIQMAYDKVKQRHFIYYNQVIKPALVGLTGPWISGGIEFNWPQHHRPSTFEPVDYTIKENPDGSKTVWVNEIERMFQTKGMAGFTLYADKAYLEIKGSLYNRTPFPQTFLWWANPAVKVNEHYQSVFPPDVYAVFDHGKRDVSSFPIAKGVYYKVNYAPGTDISRYKNIPVPTSYMAIASDYNFIGGYEHDTRGGLLHVADHFISPGKKQWTWGHGPFGRAWDRNLTDEDGPYIELMTGVFTDNQPDFSWLQPYEQKNFVQYFMPYSEVGLVKNATREAALNVEFENNHAIIKLYTTSVFNTVQVAVSINNKVIFSGQVACSPEQVYTKSIAIDAAVQPQEVLVQVKDGATGKLLVQYQPALPKQQELPQPAQAAKPPAEVENNEQLFLTGQHLEQYRHATFVAADYYEEALHRDPNDARCNNALGLWYLRRGCFAKAEVYCRKAIATLTRRNPNPYDGEPYYNLGWSLKLQNRKEEAYAAFYKSVWNDAWQHAGYLNLARIALSDKDYEQALTFIEQSLSRNTNSYTARHAKVCILRKLQMHAAALAFIESSLELDPFNLGCLFEKYLLLAGDEKEKAGNVLQQLKTISRNWEHNFMAYAFDYAHAGLYTEAMELLKVYAAGKEQVYPMVQYCLGWLAFQQGDTNSALAYFQTGASLPPDYVFPNRVEEVLVLQTAMELNPTDYKAPYYLGNLWYDKRQYAEAIACWEKSVAIHDSFATVHRNLSLAYYNKLNDPARARAAMEKAFALDNSDARVLMELDQLYKKINLPAVERLALLQQYSELTNSRDDLYLEKITLHNQLGEYQQAKDLIAARIFHPWEGGEGKVVAQYLICHLQLARQAIAQANYRQALQLLQEAENYPGNLGEGKLTGAQENDIHYLKGWVYELLGDRQQAAHFYTLATQGISEPVQAIFYNDPQPDKIFYQGLAWQRLQQPDKAGAIFNRLIQFGKEHMHDSISIDYFAVSLPDLLVFDADLNLRNKIHCLYLQALGFLGLGHELVSTAHRLFNEVLQLDVNHAGAIVHRSLTGL